jgi:hypothetical protein
VICHVPRCAFRFVRRRKKISHRLLDRQEARKAPQKDAYAPFLPVPLPTRNNPQRGLNSEAG